MVDYNGLLLFNQIHQLSSPIELDSFGNKLTMEIKDEVEPTQKQESIEEIFLPARTLDEPLPKYFFRFLDEECRWFRYTVRELKAEEGINTDGDLSTFYKPEERTCDIFLTSGGYVFFRGAKSEIQGFVDRFYSRLRDIGINRHHKEIRFDSDYLLWIFYHYRLNKSLPTELGVDLLTDAKVVGDRDRVGSFNRVSGSTDVGKSAPVLTGILNGKNISMLGGVFTLDGIKITADIEVDGRIHIKTDNTINQLNQEGRIVTSVVFLQGLCKLREHWQKLENSKRYPPIEFFEEISDNLENAGVEVQIAIEPVIEEYRKKRER
ncbi:hypothetical protein [Halorussus halophilus]|uniref:hypothetical protein n=1 Tax=Halorussus halophilus TaxID=2650975 RepID=UPI001301060B|nr:hypothetical protein [Halorussus halophilus]